MQTFLYLLIILVLFFVLGKSADFLIVNIKKISDRLKIKTSTIGIILGILTTTPELFIGINAIENKVGSISIGNLFGGIILLFTLLLGVNLVLNEKIKTDGEIKNIAPNFLFIILAMVSGLKGYFNLYDGIFFIFLYFIVIFYVNKNSGMNEDNSNILGEKKTIFTFIKNIFAKKDDQKVVKEIFIVIASVISLLICSNFIIRFSLNILSQFNISKFFIGLIMLSIGTNLPELIVVLRAFKNKNSELSLNHLIGSAMANILVLSILSLFNNFNIAVNTSYISLIIIAVISMLSITLFYRTNKSFSKKEGYILLLIYAVFIISQFFLEVA